MRELKVLTAIREQFGKPFRQIVREQTDEGLTNAELARYLGIPYPTLRYLLLREGARFQRTVEFPPERETKEAKATSVP